MPSNGRYNFRVFCDGKALEEYDIEERGDLYSCWIASEAGKNFSIRWSSSDNGVSLKCTISIDGRLVTTSVQPGGSAIDSNITGCLLNETTRKLFAFSQVTLTEIPDDEAVASSDQNLADLGSIELRVYRVEVTKSTYKQRSKPKQHFGGSIIHERSKKMSMHCATFQGAEVLKKPKKFYKTKLLEEEPHARFIFRYRPKEFLRAQGIMSDDNVDHGGLAQNDAMPLQLSSQIPKRAKRKREESADLETKVREGLKAQEILKTRQQMQELQAKLDLLEQDDPGILVKREFKNEPRAFLSVDENGVIDLTED